MTKAEAMQLVAQLKASYPRQTVDKNTIAAYASMLEDLSFAQAKAAVQRLLCSAKWFPTIAEIRAEAAREETGSLPSPEEAWGIVMRAVGKFGAYRNPVFPEPIQSAVQAVTWRDVCLTENVPSTRARFVAAYQAAQDRIKLGAQLGPHAPQRRALPEPYVAELEEGAAPVADQRTLGEVIDLNLRRLAAGDDE